jgi:hypothetical protein
MDSEGRSLTHFPGPFAHAVASTSLPQSSCSAGPYHYYRPPRPQKNGNREVTQPASPCRHRRRSAAPAVVPAVVPPAVVPSGGASVFLEGASGGAQPRRCQRFLGRRAGGAAQVVPAFSWKAVQPQVVPAFSWKAVQRLPRSPASEQVAREVDDQNGPIVVELLSNGAVDGHGQGSGTSDLPSVADTGQSFPLLACRAGRSAGWRLGLVRPFRGRAAAAGRPRGGTDP